MNLLADESVDRPIVERLRQDEHDVLYVAEMKPGLDDDVGRSPLASSRVHEQVHRAFLRKFPYTLFNPQEDSSRT